MYTVHLLVLFFMKSQCHCKQITTMEGDFPRPSLLVREPGEPLQNCAEGCDCEGAR